MNKELPKGALWGAIGLGVVILAAVVYAAFFRGETMSAAELELDAKQAEVSSSMTDSYLKGGSPGAPASPGDPAAGGEAAARAAAGSQ